MGVSLRIVFADGGTVKQFPISCRSEGIEILKGAAVHRHARRSDDSAEIQESLLIDLISAEEFGVVAEIAKKPVEFPKCSVGAIQPSIERSSFERFWLDDDKSNFKKGLLFVPSIKGLFHTN
jgi:hypothetical protein